MNQTIQTVDVYRNIHKAIRTELFGATLDAGRVDPADECARAALVGRVERLARVLASHAEHEDHFIQPLVECHLPQLAPSIIADHGFLDASIASIAERARQGTSRGDLHEVYLELARFVSEYLRHQDVEERELQPALLAAVGPQALFEAEQALIASIPPAEMAESLSLMLPAMNVDDRTEMLGGIQAGAPAEVFAGVCALAESVLAPADMATLAGRLGLV